MAIRKRYPSVWRLWPRWSSDWLDLVRFAETAGHEFDYEILGAYRYRDYVIRAFNADVPYDQFVREHLAGDLLDTPRLHPEEGFNESIIGTAFVHLGEGTHSPVDIRGDEADRVDNQIDVISRPSPRRRQCAVRHEDEPCAGHG